MAKIHVLDKHTAELIAAGEVVERPASAVKELLENAIDAGATQITLSILHGGVQQIQIADNGCGIDSDCIDKAFVRHATSKISTGADLDHIQTLGFRGEALASIASVAKVDLLTKTAQDEFASHYRIAGGEEIGLEAGARPTGTTITVEDLFYNTPARMKFLKKDVSEGTFVADAVMHAALSHPEVAFKFVREGKQQFATPGDGELKSAMYAVLGREFSRDLLLVDRASGVYQVKGLVTPPRACRASRGAQYFYVNGRYVKNRTMMAAMENAYKGTLMQGKFPGGVLMLELPPELVDVNVHPAKTEIRFARESEVFDAVYHAVRTALETPGSGECHFSMETPARKEPGKAVASGKVTVGRPFATLSAAEYRAMNELTKPLAKNEVPGLSGGNPAAQKNVAAPGPVAQNGPVSVQQPRPAYQVDSVFQPEQDKTANASPEKTAPLVSQSAVLDDIVVDDAETEPTQTLPQAAQPTEKPIGQGGADALSAIPAEQRSEAETLGTAEQTAMEAPPTSEPLRFVGEVFKTYIITERAGELCLIDKHAAHERILFERLAADYGKVDAQLLLAPVPVNLSAEEKQAVLQNLPLLSDSGIEAEDYGGNTVLVRSVPADVPVDDVEDMMVELAAHLAHGNRDALREKTEWVLHSIACRAAVKAGDRTDPKQLMALAQKIMDGSIPPFCPHGRPCVLKLTRKELEKQFGRIV